MAQITLQSLLVVDLDLVPPEYPHHDSKMGERKSKSISKSNRTTRSQNIKSSPCKSACTTPGNARLLRCPDATLTRLRRLNEAEIITLFTPLVPHPPSTTLSKDMDPFEPLGRALPRQVRHVPYRLDHGMTELHADFLPASGAVVIVICVTDNVMSRNPQAFNQQVRFARDLWRETVEGDSIAGIPIILLLASTDDTAQAYADAIPEFSALVAINDYTTAALSSAVRVLFGF